MKHISVKTEKKKTNPVFFSFPNRPIPFGTSIIKHLQAALSFLCFVPFLVSKDISCISIQFLLHAYSLKLFLYILFPYLSVNMGK